MTGMTGTRHRLRWLVGAVTAGLLTVGLVPATARAAEAQNVALGRPATAQGAHDGYPATNVTDGSQATYWEGPAGSFPQWVRIDLGRTVDISEVVLKLPASWEPRTETVAVQGSADGSTFSTLSAAAKRSFAPGSGNSVSVGVTAETRYVRVQVSDNTGWNAAQLSEVEVLGTPGGEEPQEPPAGTNLALRKPIEA